MAGDPTAVLDAPVTVSEPDAKAPPSASTASELARKLGQRSQQLKRERGLPAFQTRKTAKGAGSNRASNPADMPDLSTRDGRIQAHHEVVRRFWKGDARPPEAVSALKELSRIYDDKQALEDERTRPSPAAVGSWIVRQVLHGRSIAEAVVDLDALADAIGKAIGRKVEIASKGSRNESPALTSTSSENAESLSNSADNPAQASQNAHNPAIPA